MAGARRVPYIDGWPEKEEERVCREWLECHPEDHPEAPATRARLRELQRLSMEEKLLFVAKKWFPDDETKRVDAYWDLLNVMGLAQARAEKLERIEVIRQTVAILNRMIPGERDGL